MITNEMVKLSVIIVMLEQKLSFEVLNNRNLKHKWKINRG